MSGLAAIFHRNGRPVDRESVGAMLAAIPHRGLDGYGMRLWNQVGLGHAKAAVTHEEEDEQQPLVSSRSNCAVIADARLDNRSELLATLPDSPPTAASDAELILRAYEAWGLDAPARLLGDFAFIIWDARRQRIVCARDTSGQRSLYYRIDRRTFVAASEIHQLFQDPSVPIAPNEERIRDYLVPYAAMRNQEEIHATFYEKIYAVPAGHVVVVDARSERRQRYWNLLPPPELHCTSDHEYAAHFVNVLGEALRARLRSTRRVGATLSGGLDSSSLVCLAQHLFSLKLAEDHGFTIFSLLFDNLDCDERPFIEDIQTKYGLNVQFLRLIGIGRDFDPAPQGFMRAPQMPVTSFDAVLAAASQQDVRVLLTGIFADNCFPWTWLYFSSLLRRGRFTEFLRYLRRYRLQSGERLSKIALLYCLVPLLPLDLQKAVRIAFARRDFNRERDALTPSWMPGHLRTELLRRHWARVLETERTRRFADDPHELIYRNLYPPEVAPVSLAHPVQLAQPFADRRVHQFMLSIPPEQIFEPHPFTGDYYAGHKAILRRGMTGILPESIRTRTQKTLFTSYVLRQTEEQWGDYAAAFGPGGRSEIADRGFVLPDLFWTRLQRLRAGDFFPDGMYINRILNLETWLRTFRLPRDQQVTLPSSTSLTAYWESETTNKVLAGSRG